MEFTVEITGRKYDVTLKEQGAIFLGENDWPEDERVYSYEVFDEATFSYYSHSDPFDSYAEAAGMAMQRIIEELSRGEGE
jgi:hypothetical protein